MKIRFLVAALATLLLGWVPVVAALDAEKLGTVHFPVSCAPVVHSDFERAVALLHSFWYEEALKAFTAITTTEPTCAMGYWGIAMSVYYPLWQPPSAAMLQKGTAALEKTRGLTASRATALGDLEDPASHTARALTDPSPDPPQGSSEHSDPVSQECGVRGIVNVGFDDGGIDAQAPAPHDAALAPQGHQPGHHILEHRLVQKAGQPDQRLRVWNALAVDPAERAVHQAAPHLPLALIEAPIMEVLEDQHPQDHGRGRPQSAATLRPDALFGCSSR